MATQLLTDVAASLTKQFDPDLKRQFNRLSVAADILPKKNGAGQNCQWGARFSRGTHAASFAEGADVAGGEINQDNDQVASLGWGMYRVAFGVSGLTLAAAASSLGSPDDLLDLFRGHLMDASSDLISIINGEIYAGTGTGTRLAGLHGGGAMDISGTYAGIARGSFSEWQGNVLSNSGTARQLTKGLLDQAEASCFNACSLPPDMVVATSGVIRKYETLFDSVVRTTPESSKGELSVISRVQANSGYTGLYYKGMPVIRDRNATSGKLSMLNSQYVELRSLPQINPGMQNVPSQQTMGLNDGAKTIGINAKVEPLAKTGDSNKFQLVTYIQLVVRRPNAHARIDDIDET